MDITYFKFPPCPFCGCLGDVESTEPTKSLMRIAEYIDSHQEGEELRAWFMEDKESVLDLLATTAGHSKSNGEVAPQPRYVRMCVLALCVFVCACIVYVGVCLVCVCLCMLEVCMFVCACIVCVFVCLCYGE